MESNAQNITPEWKYPKGLVLVYPKGLRNNLTLFYKELVRTIILNSELKEITFITTENGKDEINEFCNKFKTEIGRASCRERV